MAHGIVILECPRTPQLEVWARSYGVLSAVVRDNIAQGVTPESPEAWEGRNSVNTSPNGASEESIGIYIKSKCQWSGHLINSKSEPQRYVV